MTAYAPAIFNKTGRPSKTAYSWAEHYQLLFDGYTPGALIPPPPSSVRVTFADLNALEAELRADLGGGGGGGTANTDRARSPMSFGAAGDGIEDDSEAVVDAYEWAAEFNGAVIIDRPFGVSQKVKHYGGMSVLQLATPKWLASPGSYLEVGLHALSDEFWYEYGSASDGSGSANDNPGPVKGLHIDGHSLAGDSGLFVTDCAQSSLKDLSLANWTEIGLHAGRSQNVNLWNLQLTGPGTGVFFKPLVAGQQGTGHWVFYGGHIHDCELPVHATAWASGAGGAGYAHDITFNQTIIETGRLAGMPVRVGALIEAGIVTFTDCQFTYGAQVGPSNPVTEDCAILIDNPYYTAQSTVVNIQGASTTIGGGPNGVTDAIKIRQSGAANIVRVGANVGFANVQNKVCSDGINGPTDPLLSIDHGDREITGGINALRQINGATKLNAYRKFWLGQVFEKPAEFTPGTMQAPISIWWEGEAGARFSTDWLGTMAWRKREAATLAHPAAPGYLSGGFTRVGDILATTGRFGVAQSYYRSPVETIVNVTKEVNLNWENSNYHVIHFTAGTVDVSAVNIVGVTDSLAIPTVGQHYLIGIRSDVGSEGNSIDWTAAAIDWTNDETGPQPLDGTFQHVEVVLGADGVYHETWRSHNVGGGGGGTPDLPPVVANLTGGTYTLDPVTGTDYYLTATADTTLALDAGAVVDDKVAVWIVQDGTGGHTITLPGTWKGVADVVLSEVAGHFDQLVLWVTPAGVVVKHVTTGV